MSNIIDEAFKPSPADNHMLPDEDIYGEPPNDRRELPHAPQKVVLNSLHRDEAGDAELFAYLYRNKAIYDIPEKCWYLWTKHQWVADKAATLRYVIAGHISSEYLHLAAELNAQGASIDPLNMTDEQKQALAQASIAIKRAKSLHAKRRIESVLDMAHSKKGMSIDGSKWDTDPWLLAVANGVLDLRTGELRESRPEDYIRHVAPTKWKGIDAPCPRWERFVSEILSDEPDRVGFLHRLLGYSINGTTDEHVVVVCVGARGRNGKRVLFETLQYVLGSAYAGAVSTDVLIGQEHKRIAGSAQPHLVALQGRRIAYCSETNEFDRLEPAQVKNITGGDHIRARNLYAKDIEFKPSHTLYLQTNRKPQAPADDDALWERVKVIEFKVRFVDDPQGPDERPRDLELESTLRTEASGILAWLVHGHMIWLKNRLQTPESVKLARDTYRQEESIDPFLESACVEADEFQAEGGALYEAYKNWCRANGLKAKNQNWFGKQMKSRFVPGRTSTGRSCYYGIGLETTEFEPSTSEGTKKTIKVPSDGIGMQNNCTKISFSEGTTSTFNSFSENFSHEEKDLEVPSAPSAPSGNGKIVSIRDRILQMARVQAGKALQALADGNIDGARECAQYIKYQPLREQVEREIEEALAA